MATPQILMLLLFFANLVFCVTREGERINLWHPFHILSSAVSTVILAFGGFLAAPIDWPQVVWLILVILGFAQSGSSRYSAHHYLLGVILISALYHWGGFWSNGQVL